MQDKGPFLVGQDRVVQQDDRSLHVLSREMKEDTWRTRKFRKTKILFRENPYFVAEVRDGEEACDLVYVLRPWREDDKDVPGAVIEYNEAYEAALRARVARESKTGGVRRSMLLLAPLRGQAWSETKTRWEADYNVPSLRITRIAVYASGFLGLTTLLPTGLICMGTMWKVWPPFAVSLTLTMDGLVRYALLSGAGARRYGFLEWVFRPRA